VYQVFAPIENENVYTNDWRGPFYGYDRVIETFELNDRPRRLSPISIYYHFYSGTKPASLASLRRVYDWALSKETTRLYLSEYAAKVRAFQETTLARRIDDGVWELEGLGELRTLRLPAALGWPDLTRSVGIAGVRDVAEGRYVHVARQGAVVLALTGTAPTWPVLESANGRVLAWKGTARGAALRIAGNEPLVMTIAGGLRCALRTSRGVIAGVPMAGKRRFELPSRDTGEAQLECE
jgi:hypothetical protein